MSSNNNVKIIIIIIIIIIISQQSNNQHQMARLFNPEFENHHYQRQTLHASYRVHPTNISYLHMLRNGRLFLHDEVDDDEMIHRIIINAAL